MSTTSRKDVKTVGVWTLQRREFDNDHDYIVRANGKPSVNLYVNDRYNSEIRRTMFKVEYSANTFPMNLEEASDFVAHAQYALVAATEFQQAIDSVEGY